MNTKSSETVSRGKRGYTILYSKMILKGGQRSKSKVNLANRVVERENPREQDRKKEVKGCRFDT